MAAERSIIDSGQPGANEKTKRRRELYLTLLVALFFALTTYFEYRLSHLSSRLPFVNSIFFFGLINFNIILLMVLVLLISRNVGKLVLERRRQSSRSRLKTKLVVAFLSFTIIPTMILFLISSFYINSSFDKWFSIKILNTLQTSLEITQTYYKNTSRVAQYLATQVAHEVREMAGGRSLKSARLKPTLDRTRTRSAVDGIEVYYDPLEERLVSSGGQGDPQSVLPRLPLDVLQKAFAGEAQSLVQHIGGADLIRAVTPVSGWGEATAHGRGVVAVTFIIPTSLVNRVDAVSSVFQDYKDVNPLKYPVKTTYFLILVMMTLLIIFVSIWIGLYLARELTVPLDRLVTATQKIRGGDLDFQILNTGNDEIARLTDSFNSMTGDLKRNRHEIEQRNRELGEKSRYVETVLNSVTAGVISVDDEGKVVTVNPIAAKLLNIKSTAFVGQDINQLVSTGGAPLGEMYQEAATRDSDAEPLQRQFSVGNEEDLRSLTATASPFGRGVVFVIDDVTHLTKAQREAAWREVARRIAHEIKNPLTPIKLSAQRMQKRLANVSGPDALVFKECTETIIQNVDELRDMVNEFSSFARFPSANPAPHDLNKALKEVVTLYAAAHKDIRITLDAEPRMPIMDFDRDQIKRAIINLLDNAVAVAPTSITVSTHYNERLRIAVIEVEDNGPGIAESVRNRLFEPYFSTKQGGTGLGLSIVKRIIADHSGFIRVQSQPGSGAKFTIELPINLVAEKAKGSTVYGEDSTGG